MVRELLANYDPPPKALTIVSNDQESLDRIRRESDDSIATVHDNLQRTSLHTITKDLSDSTNCKTSVDEAAREMGGIDILILNHAKSYYGDWLQDIDAATTSKPNENEDLPELVNLYYSTNIVSFILLSSYALPHLRESSEPQILAVGSLTGMGGFCNVAPYASTKSAIFGYFNSLRQDLWMKRDTEKQIHIATAVMGGYDTEVVQLNPNIDSIRDRVKFHPPIRAARDLLQGLADRQTTIYSPWEETRIAALLLGIIPRTVERITTQITTGK